MKETTNTSQALIEKLDGLTRTAYSHHVKKLEHTIAESKTVDEACRFAVMNNIDRWEVQMSFCRAGYKDTTAAAYASKVEVVKDVPKAAEKAASREKSFNEAYKEAKTERIERDPYNVVVLLKAAYANTARLALKAGLNSEEHLERSKIAYEKAKNEGK